MRRDHSCPAPLNSYMRKHLYPLLIPLILWLVCPVHGYARGGKCTGGSCTACTNCSGCKHCAKEGGSCSVCKGSGAGRAKRSSGTPSNSQSVKRSDASANGQCAAITKKGTRCSRRASEGRYCWQHAR